MNDISIRPARYEDRFALARVIVDATYSAFRGRAPETSVEALGVEESAFNWGKNWQPEADGASLHQDKLQDLLYVAEVEGLDVIGLAMAGSLRDDSMSQTPLNADIDSELFSLQVDPAWHRRGIGRRLVAEISSTLRSAGATGMQVKVLQINPNVAFYEAMGAVLVGTEPYDWEGFATVQSVYAWPGWRDLP